MLLQGLEQATKEDLLKKVIQGKLSLKEMREAAERLGISSKAVPTTRH